MKTNINVNKLIGYGFSVTGETREGNILLEKQHKNGVDLVIRVCYITGSIQKIVKF